VSHIRKYSCDSNAISCKYHRLTLLQMQIPTIRAVECNWTKGLPSQEVCADTILGLNQKRQALSFHWVVPPSDNIWVSLKSPSRAHVRHNKIKILTWTNLDRSPRMYLESQGAYIILVGVIRKKLDSCLTRLSARSPAWVQVCDSNETKHCIHNPQRERRDGKYRSTYAERNQMPK
jgi:hypothetical protein